MTMSLLVISIILAVVSCHPLSNNGRIVGGIEIDIKERPFQIALNIYNDSEIVQMCGGAIVNPDTILTAAHCLVEGYKLNIRAGSSSQFKGGVIVDVKEAIPHPEYNTTTFYNDIAILKLETPLTFSDTIKPILLADETFDAPDGEICVVSGWGDMEFSTGTFPEFLRMVEVPVVNRNVCSKAYATLNTKVTEKMICTGTTMKDACQKDSGGPLTYKGVHVGVVSLGYKCGGPGGFPGIYAKTATYRDFIDKYL